MIAEQLHDALTGLPEEMLTPLEAIRKKRPFPWKAVSAAAACLVLFAGLLLFPGQAKNASGGADFNNAPQSEAAEAPSTNKDSHYSTDDTEEDTDKTDDETTQD